MQIPPEEYTPEKLATALAQNCLLLNKVSVLEEEVAFLKHQLYGRKSEGLKAPESVTGTLFDEAEKEVASQKPEEEKEEDVIEVPAHTRSKAGRKPLSADLPRVDIVHDLPEEEKVCQFDGTPLKKIGEEVSEVLDVIPAKYQVLRHFRVKYACPCCEKNIKAAKAQPSPLAKSVASAGTLAFVTICKYLDALPLYRQEQIFARCGADISRATLANWMIGCSELVARLTDRIKEWLLERDILHADESTLQVLNEKGRLATSKSFMWLIASAKHYPPAVFYEYHETRSQASAVSLLQGFKGYLHVDGYDGYNSICRQLAVTRIGCWAHARRKFTDALKTGSNKSEDVAREALEKIKQLYAIERDIEDLSPEQIKERRAQESLPLLEEFKTWSEKLLVEIPPKSWIGKAFAYVINEWEYLCRYVDDGRLSIDNNPAENLIRPFALGRKNWLFANSPNGATASARLYSLVISAKLNHLNVHEYLTDVYSRVGTASQDVIEELLPWNWKTPKASIN